MLCTLLGRRRKVPYPFYLLIILLVKLLSAVTAFLGLLLAAMILIIAIHVYQFSWFLVSFASIHVAQRIRGAIEYFDTRSLVCLFWHLGIHSGDIVSKQYLYTPLTSIFYTPWWFWSIQIYTAWEVMSVIIQRHVYYAITQKHSVKSCRK